MVKRANTRLRWSALGVVAAGILALASNAHAANCTWRAQAGDWSVASNWGGALPNGSSYYEARAPYSGSYTLSGSGSLSVALQNSALDTSGSGVLSFGPLTAATLGGLTGPGVLSLSNTASGTVALSVGNNSTNTTFSGMLQGAGNLTKIGSGALNLSGSNTFTGATAINQGKLVVDGWLTNSAVSVNGGTLGGTGSLASVMVYSGGQLAPGDALGTLNISGNLILSAGAVMDYDLDTPSTSDEITCGSLALNLQQLSDFNFAPSANFGPGVYDLIAFGQVLRQFRWIEGRIAIQPNRHIAGRTQARQRLAHRLANVGTNIPCPTRARLFAQPCVQCQAVP